MNRMDRWVSRLDRKVRIIGSKVAWTMGVTGRMDGMMEATVQAAGLRVAPLVPDPVFEEDPVSEGDRDEAGPSQVDPMAPLSSRAGQWGRGPLPMPSPSSGHSDP